MEVDTPSEPADSGDVEADSEVEDAMKNGLKRSCSAPTINQLFSHASTSSTSSFSSSSSCSSEPMPMHMRLRPASYLSASGRWRRWSTSVSPVSPGGVSGSQNAGWARLNRLRVEETSDIGKLEIATEREIQRGISIEKNLSQSWEDLSLSDTKEAKPTAKKICDPMLPLTIGVGPFPSPRTSPSPSPSPTRGGGGGNSSSSSVTGKQCFSPSMQMAVPTNLSFSPSPSSSPTRKSWASRRSLSPITLRPSPLGPVKRKCMLDDGESTPSKRHSSCLLTTQQAPPRPAPYRIPWGSFATPQASPGPPSEAGSREGSPSINPYQSQPSPSTSYQQEPSPSPSTSCQQEASPSPSTPYQEPEPSPCPLQDPMETSVDPPSHETAL